MLKSAAIEHFGGAAKLAAALGLTRQAVHAWPDVVPDLYQYKLHVITGGKLPLDKPAPPPGEGRAAA